MAATDALPVPIKNTAFRLTLALRKNDGTLISGITAPDSQVSLDGGTFAACTNEVTEIATSSGVYYLDLTAAEMNADCVAIWVKSTSTGYMPAVVVLYPQEAGNIKVDVQSYAGGDTASALAHKDLGGAALSVTVDTATLAATTTAFETSLTASVGTDYYAGRSVIFIGGALAGQAAKILGSVFTGNSKVKLTVSTLTAAPANAQAFRIV